MYGVVELVSDDPAGWDLARTTNYLDWLINSDGTVDATSYSYMNAWALPESPPPLYTHWYVDGTSRTLPYNPSPSDVFQAIDAWYHNDDWLEDNISTNVWHSVTLRGTSDAWIYYTYQWYHSGESWYILDVDLYVMGQEVSI